jgi:hypothetical protein
VNESQVNHIEEEGDAPEYKEGIGVGEAYPIEPSHDRDGGAQSHQEKQQRGRVFGAIEEGEHGKKRRVLDRPGRGIAIDIH